MLTEQDIMNKIHSLMLEYQEITIKGPAPKRGKLVMTVTLGNQEFEITVKEKKEKCN